MGYPSSGAEGVYRNPLDSVQRFFTLRHPQAYMLFNLCSERQYDASKFQGRVRTYPCDDHNPPPFLMMKRFCEDVRLFLSFSFLTEFITHSCFLFVFFSPFSNTLW